MALQTIEIDDFAPAAVRLWAKQWLLLTAGDFAAGDYNTMTVAWGSLGCMWNKPFAQVVVRPTRYTHSFMEHFDTFTLTAFPAKYKEALLLLGSKSGRDGDKIREAGLTPAASVRVPAPAFAEAELILECRKIYWQDMTPAQFLDPEIHAQYPQKDYHRIYFGEILLIRGSVAFGGSS